MGETALAILGGLLLADALLPIIIDFMRTNEASQQARGHAKVAAQSFAAGDWLIAAHLFRGAALSVKDQPFMEGKVPNWPHFSSISVAKQKILYSLMTAESFARGGDWRQASSILTETIVNRKRGYRNIDDEWLSLLRVVTRYKGQQPTEYIKDASARIRRAQRGGYKKDLSLELKSWLHNLDATHPGILPKDLQITKNLFYQLEQLNPKSPPTRPPEKFKQIV